MRWFYNWGFRHLLNTCIEGWSKFHEEPICFMLVFLVIKKNYFWKLSWPVLLSLDYWSLFWFAKIRFRIVDKIHTKGVADVSNGKERGEFCERGKLLFLRRGGQSHTWQKGLPRGIRSGRNYDDCFTNCGYISMLPLPLSGFWFYFTSK